MSTSLVTRTGPTWKAVTLVIAGILIGALMVQPAVAMVTGAPMADPQGGAATSRWASCSDFGFFPDYEDGFYSNVGGLGLRIGRSANIPLYCALTLPHGATVREVRFHFEDLLSDEAWSDCIVGRTRLDPPNDGYQLVAGPMTSGVAFDGRFVTRKDTSISNATVNNREYAYWAQCIPSAISTGLILYGVSIRYTPA